MKADFGGYATKSNVKCSDGVTILPDAFKHQDQMRVPLVWQHGHTDVENVLGHAILENRPDGVYAYAFFNDSPKAAHAASIVEHGDIDSLSIWANKLIKRSSSIIHGMIREVSLVLAGANPGARIDSVSIRHADGEETELEDEAIIQSGMPPEVPEEEEEPQLDEKADEKPAETETIEHADGDGETVQDVYDSLNDKQKDVLHFMIGEALAAAGNNDSAAHGETTKGNDDMARNVFENKGDTQVLRHSVSHDDMKQIISDAIKGGGSLRDAVEGYAIAHGIEDINLLFPDARLMTSTPEFDKRRTEWVAAVLGRTRKSPFSRVKSITADLTQEDARAKGYIKGTMKKEEFFGLTKRTTSPTTVYKKQKLDRDDVVDIVDFDVVAWLKGEMRLMLEEEIARAILIGDGRDISHEDKVKDPIGASDGVGIRSIVNDHELYTTTVTVNVDDANSSYDEVIDSVMDGMEFYKGTGTPDFYCTIKTLNKFLKAKDTQGRRLYRDRAEVAAALGVNSIITVEVMNDEPTIVGIIVNLADYNVGADKGGEVSMFDDFDIDYNQQKYLIETRLSGALVKIKSAIVVRKTASTNVLVAPNEPTFNSITGVLTIVNQTGVVYKNEAGTVLNAAGSPYAAIDPGASMTVYATPATGYYFASSEEDEFTFTRES